MKTDQNNELNKYLLKEKIHIIDEVVRLFHQYFSWDENTEETVSVIASDLLYCYLTDISEGRHMVNDIGIKIGIFMRRKQLDIGNMLAYLGDIRIFLENLVRHQPVGKLDQAEGIAKINSFFIDVQTSIILPAMELLNEELANKSLEIRKKEEQLLRNERERVQVLSKLSNSFAHEIRNPLTSIKGFVQLLESRIEKPCDEKMYFHYINQEIEELEDQVNQILFLSNRKNHQDFKLKPVQLNGLIVNALQTFQPVFYDHQVQVNVKLLRHTAIKGVEDQIKLACYKLIQNAVDALLTKENNRKIEVELKQHGNAVSLVVSNNGPPIPTVLKESIFDPFVSTKELGKGIGLAITKQIIEKHQGTIQFISDGYWTTFTLTFPENKIINDMS
ncbi:sensor histidine kinase [Evansella tamaricis]|uniref:HAMP domain-containing histidine kinase n=1 Tax=Evansella tamaricis TaxID=2069301 RepID=A0ABS6JKC3_9BACI|nr:HAMP domain-containing sensor histidine kinase [Evansella tamaricis]MBU9713988.1 HAMP domain-containing histidine kinase [Evansella tamaricis]